MYSRDNGGVRLEKGRPERADLRGEREEEEGAQLTELGKGARGRAGRGRRVLPAPPKPADKGRCQLGGGYEAIGGIARGHEDRERGARNIVDQGKAEAGQMGGDGIGRKTRLMHGGPNQLGGEGALLILGLHQAEEAVVVEKVNTTLDPGDTRRESGEGAHDVAPHMADRAQEGNGEGSRRRVRGEGRGGGTATGDICTGRPGRGAGRGMDVGVNVTEGIGVAPLPLGESKEVAPKLPDVRGQDGRVEKGGNEPAAADRGGVEAGIRWGARDDGNPGGGEASRGRDEQRSVGGKHTHVGVGERGNVSTGKEGVGQVPIVAFSGGERPRRTEGQVAVARLNDIRPSRHGARVGRQRQNNRHGGSADTRITSEEAGASDEGDGGGEDSRRGWCRTA